MLAVSAPYEINDNTDDTEFMLYYYYYFISDPDHLRAKIRVSC